MSRRHREASSRGDGSHSGCLTSELNMRRVNATWATATACETAACGSGAMLNRDRRNQNSPKANRLQRYVDGGCCARTGTHQDRLQMPVAWIAEQERAGDLGAEDRHLAAAAVALEPRRVVCGNVHEI